MNKEYPIRPDNLARNVSEDDDGYEFSDAQDGELSLVDDETNAFSPSDQPKTIEKAPIWELVGRYEDVGKLHDLAIAVALEVAEDPDNTEKREHLEALNVQLVKMIAEIRRNLDFQEEHDMVQHKWTLGLESFGEALDSGVRTIEMDIRSTKDGHPVVSHALKLKENIFQGKKVSEMTLDEIKEKFPDTSSMDEIFAFFQKYREDHELVLELKDISSVDGIVELIKKYDLADAVRIASLSPAIIEAAYEKCPEIKGFLLNGGITPFLTVPIEDGADGDIESRLEKFLLKGTDGWRAGKMGSVEIVFSGGTYPSPKEAKLRGEGVHAQTGYAFFRIPEEMKEILGGDRSSISLSAVLIASNIISLFSKKTGEEMMRSYAALAEQAGLKTMATTWMEKAGKVIKPLRPEEQFKLLKKLGVNTIYTLNPAELARKARSGTDSKNDSSAR
ncbi:MAG: glycerophosphodiester phosphodiesterase family protein [Patescibacteria group bacterium]